MSLSLLQLLIDLARSMFVSSRVPRPLLNHRSLACYHSYSLETPYEVIDTVLQENVRLAISWCLPMHDSSIADMPICNRSIASFSTAAMHLPNACKLIK